MSTKEHDIEAAVAQVTADLQQKRQKQWYAAFLSPLWLCILIALVLRIWLAVHTHGVIDGDEGVLGIQAQHILHGEFPVYFYGQAYMGSLEAYLVAILFAIAGSSVWTLRAEPILLSLLIVWLTWKLAEALAEAARLPSYARRLFMTISALLAALPPLYGTVLEMRLLGGYIETFVLMLLMLLSAFHLTRRWFAGASSKELAWRWAGIGFIIGLGLWVNPLLLSSVLAAAIWIAGYCIVEIIRRSMQKSPGTQHSFITFLHLAKGLLLGVVALPACLVALIPALIWGANNHWANVAYIHNLGGTISRHRISIILQVADAYRTCVAPRIIGGALPSESSMLTALHWPLVYVGEFCIFAVVGLVAISFVWPHPSLVRIRWLAALPTLFAACTAFAFCTGSASVFVLLGCALDDAGRYATPLMLALPFLFATLFTALSLCLYERGQRQQQNSGQQGASTALQGKRFLRPLSSKTYGLSAIGQVLLFAVLLAYLVAQASTYVLTDPGRTFQSNYCPIDPANNDPIITYMQQQHIHYFWASNLLAYPIVFKVNSSIIGADPTPLRYPLKASNRIPAYTDAVLHADRPSMLVIIDASDRHPLLLRLLDARHVTYRMAVFPSQPGYDVLVVTPVSRTVSPLESKDFDIFGCYS